MKLLKYIIVVFIFSSCIDSEPTLPLLEYDVNISGVLSEDGKSLLPMDENGYYRLKLIRNNQQPHRITGTILVNNNEPKISERIEWDSNLYWWLLSGDTIANITKTYINYFNGEFTTVILPPYIASKDEIVPTINKVSYSGKGGEFNTIIAPIRKMKGDTLVVKLSHTESKIFKIINIVLE
jgi:hypothetical protein